MKALWLYVLALLVLSVGALQAKQAPTHGLASWYGEEHRGRLMANGKPFDPDRLTAASWFYPLGTKVRVVALSEGVPVQSVIVTITDRGPAHHLVRDGRIIDLAHGAFQRLSTPGIGLIEVRLQPLN